jgi:histidinol phosphatase-like enzyme
LEEFKKYIYERIYKPRPYIFLDRDGTINEIVFNEKLNTLIPRLLLNNLFCSRELLRPLKFSIFRISLIVVTNQPAAAKGKVN